MSKPQASRSTRSLKTAPIPKGESAASALYCAGGMPKAVEGRGLLQDPADERLVEDRREALLVERALFVERPGLEHDRRVEAMQARKRVAGAEDMPEQAVTIEIAGEKADAAAAERRPLVPVGARGRIELCAQPPVIGGDVGARVGAAEEAEEGLIVRQVLSAQILSRPSAICAPLRSTAVTPAGSAVR